MLMNLLVLNVLRNFLRLFGGRVKGKRIVLKGNVSRVLRKVVGGFDNLAKVDDSVASIK